MSSRLPPLIGVSDAEVDALEQEVLVRAEAKKRGATAKVYDPSLGSTAEEAEQTLFGMRSDIEAYGRYVFGYEPARVHQVWNRIVDDVIARRVPQNKLLIIAPPNSAKSTWNSLIRPCHYLGNHPDHHIIFLTSSDPMAGTFGSAVRSTLEYNGRHKEVFPEDLCRPNKSRGWSSDGLYLRGTPYGVKDPAYKAVGYNATIMGSRAHGIILDDPLDQKNASSETDQRRAKEYYDQTLAERLQPGIGWMLGIMTRFHENDLASHFIRQAEESGDWIIFRTPQIAQDDDPLGREPGELLWPERLTAEYVEAARARLGSAQFNLVHQGDPTGIGGEVFKEERWFRDLPSDFWSQIFPKCQIVWGWDLAFSENKKACFTVGVGIAVDAAYNMYILNVYRKKHTIGEVEEDIVKLTRMSKPLVVGIETDRFHQQTTVSLARRIYDRVMCNIQLLRPDTDKISRATMPAARAEAGKVFVWKTSPWYPAFISECLGFPLTRYKDQVDAFSLAALLVEKLEEIPRQQKVIHTEYALA